MRHISLDLIRVTEAAAISASKWIGSGNKKEADKAATGAMRDRLNKMDFAGRIVIGEGEKDCGNSTDYGLYADECVGKLGYPFCGEDPSAGSAADSISKNPKPKIYEIAVDPIEGTSPTVAGGPEAISTLAVAHEGSMYTMRGYYMRKLAYGPNIRKKVRLSIDDSISRTIEFVALATGKYYQDITVCVLNRPRHNEVIKELRSLGVRIKLIQDCDVSGAIATCLPDSGVDLLYGIGGSPEAVLSATAIKCMGGDLQAKEVKGNKATNVWKDVGDILFIEDLVKGPCVFVATGITNGSILRGVRFTDHGSITNSVFMRSESGTIRWITSNHGN